MITFKFVRKVVKGMKIGTIPGAGTAIRNRGGYAFGLEFSGYQSALLASFGHMLTAINTHPKGKSARFTKTICFECLSPRVAAA